MNCPLCGDICRCFSEPDTISPARWMPDVAGESASAALLTSPPAAIAETQLIDPEAADLSEQRFVASLEETSADDILPEPERASLQQLAEAEDPGAGESSASPNATAAPETADDTSAWREELSARLSHYRARRKAKPPRYPSLTLPFEGSPRIAGESDPPSLHSSAPVPSPAFDTVSNQALALNLAESDSATVPSLALSQPVTHGSAKIIEFPRSTETGPPVSWDELAGPVIDRPRILDVPDVTPPPPALGGITIDAMQSQEAEKRPGIDIPLHSSSLGRRLIAAAIDGLIVTAASALFGYIFWKIVAVRPPLLQILGLGAGIPALFWATYQYLLIVYSGSTPGIRVAGLEINRFDGTLTNRRLRRWRVLASCLSAVSLGMGYAWVLLDEDSLCWHDRITRTYLAPPKR